MLLTPTEWFIYKGLDEGAVDRQNKSYKANMFVPAKQPYQDAYLLAYTMAYFCTLDLTII